MLLAQLVLLSARTAASLDRAAMSVAYGEEAAEHYGEAYTLVCGLRDWATGLREGWSLARPARAFPAPPQAFTRPEVTDALRLSPVE